MKIPVLDVHAHGHPHLGTGGQLFSMREILRRAAELEDGGVFAFNHFSAQFNLHRATVARVRHKIPDGGRTGLKRSEAFEIQR